MAIGYTPQTWANGAAPALSAANLQTIDNGINAACDAVDALDAAGINTAPSAKVSLADADEALVRDSADSSKVKKITFTVIFGALWTKLGALIAGGTSKDTPVDTDTLPLADSASSSATKKLRQHQGTPLDGVGRTHRGGNQ